MTDMHMRRAQHEPEERDREQVGRIVRAEIAIDAPIEAVWKAISDPEELVNWFPLKAGLIDEVTLEMAWREHYRFRARIEEAEAPNHFRTVALDPNSGEKLTTEEGLPMVTDYYLSTERGRTVVRVVQSGFGTGADWDEWYDGTVRGWAFELRGLRHYLEHHRGRTRRVAWVRRAIDIPLEEAWDRLTGPEGLAAEGSLDARLSEGDRYRVVAATGDVFEGEIQLFDPPKDLSATVESMNDGLLRMKNERFGGRAEVNLFLSTYDVPADQVEAFEERWRTRVDQLFG